MLSQAATDDAEELYSIEAEAFPADEAADLEGIRFRIANAGEYFLKFIIEDKLAGYVNGTLCVGGEVTHESMSEHNPDGTTLILHSVTIEQSFRRNGHGRAMLLLYVDEMKKRGYVKKILLLAKKYLCPFYESCGFTTLRVSPVEHGQESWYELAMEIDDPTISTNTIEPPVVRVLVIGAAGAIGKCLVEKLLSENIEVVAALRNTPLPETIRGKKGLIQEFGIDCTDENSITKCFEKHSPIDTVWNLAAPLSVETASDPEHAFNVVVNGMKHVLQAMRAFDVPRICFSDSIGSFGGDAPRVSASASWLVLNPHQDPGSDYGIQKRKCRELMRDFEAEKPLQRSCRWAVIPGVLHSDPTWGAGTTEYALDAIKCAIEGKLFECPIVESQYLPMIWRDDLIRGLYTLTVAKKSDLLEPDGGYAMSGLSFSPQDLFTEITTRISTFTYHVEKDSEKLLKESKAAVFARLWVDSLSPVEAQRDLGFKSEKTNCGELVDIITREWMKRKRGKL